MMMMMLITGITLQWLPNQLYGTYTRMEEVAKVDGVAEECEELLGRVRDQRVQLTEEVARFKKAIDEAEERKGEAK